jgi:hypothetical protein
VRSFKEQLRRAVKVQVDDSRDALAFVDHYLGLVGNEPRSEILGLVAASAGAWLGELVRREVGGFWVGDGRDPRRLRLLLAPQFLWFAPVDVAWDVLVRGDEDREPDDPPLDTAFHLHPPTPSDDDAAFVEARLAELPEVDAATYYTLTARFETLLLVLELLAWKRAHAQRPPRELGVADYLAVLAEGL